MIGTHVQHDLLLVERSCQVLGADANINLAVPPNKLLEACAALEACLDWLSEVDQRLTPSDPASELAQVNARAGHWQPVSALLLAVVQEALRQSLASAGLFDPTLGSSAEEPGALEERSRALGGWRAIQLDPKHRGLYLPAGMQLQLHGLAKGWAADVVGKRLARSFANVLVKVGGTLLLHGRQTRYALWAAGLRTTPSQPLANPLPERAAITVRQGGLATESTSASEWSPQHWQPAFDPRPLPPALHWKAPEAAAPDEDAAPPRIASVTALARTAAHAEVAALLALQRGYPEALQAVEAAWRDDKASRPHLWVDRNVALLLVLLESGDVLSSANMEAYLERYAGGNRQ